MSNQDTKQDLINKLAQALIDEDTEAIRELMRCPYTRAKFMVEAFKVAIMKDSSIAERKLTEEMGYHRGVFKPKWNNTPTKTIRVPLKFARDILALAHRIDKDKLDPATILDEEDYIHAQPTKRR